MKGKLMLDFFRMQRNRVTRDPLMVFHLRSREVRDKYQQYLEQHLSHLQCDAKGG